MRLSEKLLNLMVLFIYYFFKVFDKIKELLKL